MRADTVSNSTYDQMCRDIERELDAMKLGRRLCGAVNDIRTQCCYTCKSISGRPKKAREDLQRLDANLALRLGFRWRHTGRVFCSMGCEETKRALEHAKCARSDGFESTVDRYAKSKVYATRMDSIRAEKATLQEWGSPFRKRETSPVPIDRAPYQQRQWTYLGWDCRVD